ncbi:glycosyltransferase family 2 protein [Thiohalobacter sp.]|uniref:glycosyltransferase family 2 protein n=1 Tax=Thiohalobacter sp. TaxID=2025948 RepID=UPI00261F28CB|nr:glycosyltransferase family 2 protein [Thiohalobacter sp.]
MRLTVVICTHDRAESLDRTLDALMQAEPPAAPVDILVVANACGDDTAERLRARAGAGTPFPLHWIEEPLPGKSRALNRALALLQKDAAAFVDDDQRVAPDFLVETCAALERHADAGILCGRLLPDWDGSEPAWVHDTGPWRIYPPPVASFDAGDAARDLDPDDVLPPGGDIIARREVLERVGEFAVELGPHGHDLLGGEDIDYLRRALALGIRLRYEPRILQYHAVEAERLRLRELVAKAFQRSRSSVRIARRGPTGIQRYMWKKVAIYGLQALASLSASRRRFYLVRLAAALGEMRGASDRARRQAT